MTAGRASGERMRDPRIAALFAPRSIAIVGASDRNFYARNALHRLEACGYAGDVHLVNLRADAVAGRTCHPDISAIGRAVDLAFIAVPRTAVVKSLSDAVAAGARAAVVVTTGFGESADDEGRVLQRQLSEWIAGSPMAVCGPSCLGVINVHGRMQAFGGHPGTDILPGVVALVSQSGANVHTYVGAALARNFGYSYIVSSGNEAGLDACDYIDAFVDDERTRVICAYIESFKHPGRLPAIAERARAAGKPIVLIKIGRSQSSSRAALAHTGSMTGPDAYYEALFAQHGIVRAFSIEEALDRVAIFATTPARWWPRGGRAAVVSVSGGFAGALSDMTSGARMSVPELAEGTVASIRNILPPHVSPQNPLDLSTQVRRDRPEAWRDTLAAVAADDGVDLVLDAEATPMDETRLRSLAALRDACGKPVLLATTSLHIDIMDETLSALARDLGLPLLLGVEGTHRGLETALAWAAGREEPAGVSTAEASKRRQPLPHPGRKVLNEVDARALLARYGIAGPVSHVAVDADEAAEAGARIGGRLALKVVSDEIAHRSDRGLVMLDVPVDGAKAAALELLRRLNLTGEGGGARILVQAMSHGVVELFIGVTVSEGHAPLLVVGTGGVFVELLGDRSTRLCPVDEGEAVHMLRSLRLFPLLDGYRGRPKADLAAAARAIVAVSAFALDADDWLAEAEINPLMVMADGGGAVAVDALVVAR